MNMHSRRSFLKMGIIAGGAPAILPMRLPGQVAANSRLSHAAIGVGGMGWNDLNAIAALPNARITALCDVDANHLARAAEVFPDARTYRDWRELIAAEGDKVDSVSVSTPDHLHASVMISALRAGKHVYCQKPLTHTVNECRAIAKTAKAAGTVTQMGNHIQSAIEYRSGVEMIKAGIIGEVKEIHAWSRASFPMATTPEKAAPVPDSLEWDLWLGPAAWRAYAPEVYAPFNWRAFQDFGGSGLGDFGCHIMDSPFRALDLKLPTSIKVDPDPAWKTSPAGEIGFAAGQTVHYSFANDVKLTWYDGTHSPDKSLFPFGDNENTGIPAGGSLFLGDGGALLLPHVGGPRLLPREANRGIKRPDLEPMDHYGTYVDACLGGAPTTGGLPYAALLTETVLLGVAASHLPGETHHWDAKKGSFHNPAIDSRLGYDYRDGWKIEGLG